MSVKSGRVTQLSRSTAAVDWVEDSTPPLGFRIDRIAVSTGIVELAIVNGTIRTLVDDTLDNRAIGEELTYQIENLQTLEAITLDPIYVQDPDVPFTNAPPDPLASTPRYTDLETVKRRLRIPAANTDFDNDLTEAIVAAEIALDYELGQSFPSTGTNPQYGGIPRNVRTLCTSAAIAVYKAADAPLGTAGSDDWFGALTIADVASQTIRRSPLIRGLQITFGIG